MNDYYDSVMSHVDENFKTNIPKIFHKNIDKTFQKWNKNHSEEIQVIYRFYQMIRYYHPDTYISKQKMIINNDLTYCAFPTLNGTIENALRLFEKQYFDILYLLSGGMYRPIMSTLRYMLEQSTWIAASIINKKILTEDASDRNKTMSHQEFKYFLHTNMQNFQKNKSNKDYKLKTISGIQELPYKYIQCISTMSDKNKSVKQLHSELSKYAHANIWYDLEHKFNLEDSDKDPTHIESAQIYVSNPSFSGYHKSLKMILETHKIIFYLFLITTYENVGYYSQDSAKQFFNDIRIRVSEMQSKVEFKNIMTLLDNPPDIEHVVLKNGGNYDYDTEYRTCSECGCECVDNKDCPTCADAKYHTVEVNDPYIL